MADAIQIKGLRELQRDLKAIQPDARKEITKALKGGAQLVQRTGKPYIARQSGELEAGWRAGATMLKGYVRNRVPYAGVLEFGGQIAPRGTPFTIEAQPTMTRALEDKQEAIVDLVGDAIERVALRNGWH